MPPTTRGPVVPCLLLALALAGPAPDARAGFEGPSSAAALIGGARARDTGGFRGLLDRLAPELMREFPTPGVSVALLERGEVVAILHYGHADLERQRPITDSTRFGVASLSKMVTALGVLRLVESGRMDLDAPIGRYVRRWRLPDGPFDPSGVTIRRLLSHSAGLSPGGGPGYPPGDPLPAIEAVLSGTAPGQEPLRLVREPGSASVYSNGGFGLLQLAIEETMRAPFAEAMRREVLEPLRMWDSGFGEPQADRPGAPHATAHDWRERPVAARRYPLLAAGGLYASPRDMARLARAGIAQRSRLATLHAPGPGTGAFGLGHVVRDAGPHRIVGHTGLETGWNASLQIVPATGQGIVILTNGDNGYYVHHALVFAWSRAVLGSPLAADARVPALKRIHRTAGAVEIMTEEEGIDAAVAAPLLRPLEDARADLEAGRSGPAAAALRRFTGAVDAARAAGALDAAQAARLHAQTAGASSWLAILP